MFTYLVHHGDALGPDVDPQRPLSVAGLAKVNNLASRVAARDVRPRIIWHSGKLRARQTAAAFWRECNPLAEFSASRWMQPGDPPHIGDLLPVEDRDVMLVGHLPHLDRLLDYLELPAAQPFPSHGCVALERLESGWVERWRLTG